MVCFHHPAWEHVGNNITYTTLVLFQDEQWMNLMTGLCDKHMKENIEII